MKFNPMVRLFVVLLCGLGFTIRVQAQDLLYFVEMDTFYDAEARPYIEINLDINAYSVAYKEDVNAGFKGVVGVKYQISPKQNPDKVVYSRSFDLLSPSVRDTSPAGTAFGIMDVRRVMLEPGEFVLEGFLQDKQRPDALNHKFVKEFIVDAQPTDKMNFSSVTFIQSLKPAPTDLPHTKHGLEVLPLVNDGNFINSDSLTYYVETYNTNRQTQQVYFANTYLTQANSSGKLRNYSHTRRMNAKALDIVSGTFNIRGLSTGTYYLNVDVYNQTQELIGQTARKFYIVSNVAAPMETSNEQAFDTYFGLSEEELDYFIRTLYYISTTTEQDFAASLSTLAEKRNFFYHFWEKRKEKPVDAPSKPWLAYKTRIDYANQHYRAAKFDGWRTDMGRILLTYGPPNEIERYPSSNTKHPHEIWRYNKINTQANVRFIFFNPNLATNDYALLHSDLRGERNNPRYEFDLVRSTVDGNLDVNTIDGQKQR